MKCVYLLRSQSAPQKRYVGSSANFQQRMDDHNAGQTPHTSRHKPWTCVVSIWFDDDAKADAFERYLKDGSGHAFASRHFW